MNSSTYSDFDHHINSFPLHEAVVVGDHELVDSLLNRGHCVNAMHFDRVTPLHMACLKGDLDMVVYLTLKGALVNSQNIDNSTPLCDACAGGSVECVKYMLDSGAWVNPPLLLSTPLHEAALRGRGEICSLLIEAGAKVNSNDLHYGTPIHAVCSMREPNLECIEVLLKAGANVNAIKNHKTALHLIASNSGSTEAAKLLVSYGANVYLRDGNGRTARDLSKPKSELREFLKYEETHPRTLKMCCRLSFIRSLSRSARISLSCDLSIPHLLLKYLE